MKKSIMVVSAILSVSFSFANASDYARAELGMSATLVPLSKAVCHRATGNDSSCTTTLSCGAYTLWPTSSQVKKFKRYSGHIKVTSQDQTQELCWIK